MYRLHDKVGSGQSLTMPPKCFYYLNDILIDTQKQKQNHLNGTMTSLTKPGIGHGKI